MIENVKSITGKYFSEKYAIFSDKLDEIFEEEDFKKIIYFIKKLYMNKNILIYIGPDLIAYTPVKNT